MSRSIQFITKSSLGPCLLLAFVWGCSSNGTFSGDDWTPGPRETREAGVLSAAGAEDSRGGPANRSDAAAGAGSFGSSGNPGSLNPLSEDSGAPAAPVADAGSDNGIDASTSTGGNSGGVLTGCTSGNRTPPAQGINMAPGRACGSCHANTFSGTVYPTEHEPNDCRGSDGKASAAKIVVTGANGKVANIPVSNGGNFYANMAGMTLPYSVKVVAGATERVMKSKTSNGDCNSCHTQDGTSGAPGRVLMP
jgi:cytochrome c5